jgi:hypothetical protein
MATRKKRSRTGRSRKQHVARSHQNLAVRSPADADLEPLHHPELLEAFELFDDPDLLEGVELLDGLIGTILASAEEELRDADALAAECWASSMLAAWAELDLPDEDALELLVRMVAERAERSTSAVALGLLHVLGTLLSGPVAELARAAVDELTRLLGITLPAWAGGAGRSRPMAALVASDPYGDQDSVVIVYQDEPRIQVPSARAHPLTSTGRHVIVALVDHNLYGVLKDVFVTDQVGEVLEQFEVDDLHGRPCDPADALGRIERALRASRSRPDRAVHCDEDTIDLEPLLSARVAAAGIDGSRIGQPGNAGASAAAGERRPSKTDIEAELARLVTSPAFGALRDDRIACDVAAKVVAALARDGGLPLRLSPLALLLLLFDGLAGRRWTGRQLDKLPAVLTALIALRTRPDDVGEAIAEETIEALEAAWPHARRLLASGRQWAPNRRAAMDELVQLEAVDDDEDDLRAWTPEEVAEATAELEAARARRQDEHAAARSERSHRAAVPR